MNLHRSKWNFNWSVIPIPSLNAIKLLSVITSFEMQDLFSGIHFKDLKSLESPSFLERNCFFLCFFLKMESFDSALYVYDRLFDSYNIVIRSFLDQFLQINVQVAGNNLQPEHFMFSTASVFCNSPRLLLATHLQKCSYPSFPLATNQFHSQSWDRIQMPLDWSSCCNSEAIKH